MHYIIEMEEVMNQTNAIIITVVLSVVLGACGFFGVKYFLTRDTAENPEPGLVMEGSGGAVTGETSPPQDGDTSPLQGGETSSSQGGDTSPPQGGETGNQQASGPSGDYPHPVILSASAVIHNSDSGFHDFDIVLTITFRNDSPGSVTVIGTMLCEMDSDILIFGIDSSKGDDKGFPADSVKPGETVSISVLYMSNENDRVYNIFTDLDLRIGLLNYWVENGGHVDITDSPASAYDGDISKAHFVPVVVSR